jgi:hypothetical protein
MATIKERKGRFSCSIRKRNGELNATFSSKETAELWARYKEDLIDEISSFNPEIEEMFTLGEAISFKEQETKDRNLDKKTQNDIYNLYREFEDVLHVPLKHIDLDYYIKKAERMLNTIVRKGGARLKPGTGLARQQSPSTVLRKFTYLGGVYSLMQKRGLKIENLPQKICEVLRDKAEMRAIEKTVEKYKEK